MRNSFTQLVVLTLGYALLKRMARRYCENASAKRKAADLQLQTWDDEGGAPAPSTAS
jgi:hypothetical protein